MILFNSLNQMFQMIGMKNIKSNAKYTKIEIIKLNFKINSKIQNEDFKI